MFIETGPAAHINIRGKITDTVESLINNNGSAVKHVKSVAQSLQHAVFPHYEVLNVHYLL